MRLQLLIIGSLALAACTAREAASAPYVPGLGEIMTLTQMRHANPLAALRSAVDRRDRQEFEAAYDALTAGCNACHQAMKFGFNVVRRPDTSPFPNQDFAPRRPATP